jgi:hypothetical protein
MSDVTATVELWNEIKALVNSIDVDVTKNAKGNASAGVRVRKGLRLLRGKATQLVKVTLGREEPVEV